MGGKQTDVTAYFARNRYPCACRLMNDWLLQEYQGQNLSARMGGKEGKETAAHTCLVFYKCLVTVSK